MPLLSAHTTRHTLANLGLLGIFICASLTSCKRNTKPHAPTRAATPSKRSSPGYPLSVTDDRGKSIKIATKPKRIVVGGTPLYTEILLDLGAKDRIVGIADSPNTPPGAKGLPSVGRAWPLNVEKVLALQPDIVFCAMAKSRQKLEQDANIKVFTGGGLGGFIQTVEQLYALIRKIDKIVHGNQARSKALLSRIQKGLKALRKPLARQALVSAAIVYVPKPQSARLYVIGAASSPGSSLIKQAKGRNVFGDQKGGLLGIEALLARNPAVLITDPKHIKRLYKHRALRSLQAIRNKRVVGIQASHYTSSRLLRVFRQLARALHPSVSLPPSAR